MRLSNRIKKIEKGLNPKGLNAQQYAIANMTDEELDAEIEKFHPIHLKTDSGYVDIKTFEIKKQIQILEESIRGEYNLYTESDIL